MEVNLKKRSVPPKVLRVFRKKNKSAPSKVLRVQVSKVIFQKGAPSNILRVFPKNKKCTFKSFKGSGFQSNFSKRCTFKYFEGFF
jgi:hypothetical protein